MLHLRLGVPRDSQRRKSHVQRPPEKRVVVSKVLIVPFFGQLPDWYENWERNVERMREFGYDFLHDEDEDSFRDRVRDKLGIEPPPMENTGRVWNFRPAFGVLYEDEIKDFDWWGHTDFDVVYGRVENWYTDDFLADFDIAANGFDYISGPWTLYRNTPVVNTLFLQTDEWRGRMEGEDASHGWAEKGFTEIVNNYHRIRRRYDYFQTKDLNDFSTLTLHDDGRLMEGNTEVCLAHFRRAVGPDGNKTYPKGCR